MGKLTLMAIAAFTFVITYMLIASNQQRVELSQKTSVYYTEIIANSIAASGARIALSRLFEDETWQAGIAQSGLNGGMLSVTLADVGGDIRITSQGNYLGRQKFIQVLAAPGTPLDSLAIFTTGSVTNVTAYDENGNPDTNLLKANQPKTYNVNHQGLVNIAITQGHVQTASTFEPVDGYPNGDFYNTGSTPNITHVWGDLVVHGGRKVYGIFVVEGDIILKGSSRVEGVLYLENSTHTIIYGGGSPSESSVTGGVVSNGDIDGTGNHISVTHRPEYMTKFIEEGNVKGGKFSIKSWQEVAQYEESQNEED